MKNSSKSGEHLERHQAARGGSATFAARRSAHVKNAKLPGLLLAAFLVSHFKDAERLTNTLWQEKKRKINKKEMWSEERVARVRNKSKTETKLLTT